MSGCSTRQYFPASRQRNPRLPGNRATPANVGNEVEFTTVMSFDSLDNVIAFQGEDYETAYVPDAARKILKRWDARSTHHEQRQVRQYG